jgi:uncharacterized damage-inducible protein DinB
MLTSPDAFASYFAAVRQRTLTYVQIIPPDRLEWTPKAGEFSCGDIVRHLAAAEVMFVRVVADGTWHIHAHQRHPDDTLAGLIARLELTHAQAIATLRALPVEILSAQRASRDGPPVSAWRWLMVLAEHEIQHRGQLAVYLSLMGVTPP